MSLMNHMANVYSLVQSTTLEYFGQYRTNVYGTPKYYLSFLKSYQVFYTDKFTAINSLADKINNGLLKLREAQEDVSKMNENLASVTSSEEVTLAEA
jgi:hypothetical protein